MFHSFPVTYIISSSTKLATGAYEEAYEDVLSPDATIFQTTSHFGFISIHRSGIYMLVTRSQCDVDRILYFLRF
jgi:hypothetical protein